MGQDLIDALGFLLLRTPRVVYAGPEVVDVECEIVENPLLEEGEKAASFVDLDTEQSHAPNKAT